MPADHRSSASLTRRHFRKIADVMAGELALAGGSLRAQHTIRSIALSLADVCASENPRFDRGRFYVACGLSADGGLS